MPARPRPKRVRRSPEEARALILDAAERVFARALPDVVGLKDVAREAGVSHALVTHYFGTYAGLVEATLERHFERLRAVVLEDILAAVAEGGDAAAMLAAQRRTVARAAREPGLLRLAAWALMSGRVDQEDFFAHRVKGLKLLADALESRARAPREDLEFALFASFALTVVWTLGKRAIAGALGRRATKELDEDFERRTAAMIEATLTRRGR